MPLETLVPASTTSNSAALTPTPITVENVLMAIAADAVAAAGEYLRDTEVPHGGE